MNEDLPPYVAFTVDGTPDTVTAVTIGRGSSIVTTNVPRFLIAKDVRAYAEALLAAANYLDGTKQTCDCCRRTDGTHKMSCTYTK